MPTLSIFYGIAIRMFCAPKEHNPPHIHAFYQGYDAIFSIINGELVEGEFPNKQRKFVEAWIEIHKESLLVDWEIAQKGERPLPIEPLK